MEHKIEDDKVYLRPGDVVTLRQHKNMHCPTMLVIKKEQSYFKDGMLGMRCRWFTTTNLLQEAIFNTRDLILVK